MRILLLDNYDSFTYNLRHMLLELGARVDVYRNDRLDLDIVAEYDKVMISPGPGIPSESGVLLPLLRRYAPSKSIFGVCLGMQAIGEVFGGTLINLSTVYHGVSSEIRITVVDSIYRGMSGLFSAGRYHSWVVSPDNFPPCLEITSIDTLDGMIMSLRHRTYDLRGVQFHPESVLTPYGRQIIENWLKS